MTRSQQIALLATAVFIFLAVLVLCLCRLSWNSDKAWPPKSEAFIELAQAEEFIVPEEIPLPTTAVPGQEDAPALIDEDLDNPAELASQSGVQREAAGPAGQPAQTVTTKRNSDVKVAQKPQPTKPGANESNKKTQSTARRTNNEIENAFAKSQSKNNANNPGGDIGKAGRRTGRADSAGPSKSAANTSGSHVGGGFGWPTLAPNIECSELGSVTIFFTLNPDGTVAQASASSSSLSPRVKAACIRYVRSLKFPFNGSTRPTEPITGNRLVINFK